MSSLTNRFLTILAAATTLASLSACQTVRSTSAPRHVAAELERARQAWQTLQRVEPGSPADLAATQRYDHAVVAVLGALRGREGSATWGQPIRSSGSRPWVVTFESAAEARAAGRLSASEFQRCRPAGTRKPIGFDRLVSHPGLGVPVVMEQRDSSRVRRAFHPPGGEFLPATAVLEFPPAIPGQPAEARLRFHDPLADSTVMVARSRRRLAENLTAALQGALTNEPVEKEEAKRAPPSVSGEAESGLFFVTRYDKTRIPVVFAHGLLSGPAVWKNTVNELLADPVLRRRYQPVCFVYPSKLSIPSSAARLRQLLKRSREQLDPHHENPGFGRMVLVGHSMGGLVARMQAINSGNSFWRAFFAASPEKVARKLDAGTLDGARSALFFRREPDVGLLVFIATPHRGAELADSRAIRAPLRLILSLPEEAKKRLKSLVELPPAYIHPVLRDFHGWGIEGTENLSARHPFFQALAQRPIEVPYHSIIATRGRPNTPDGTDGLVPYRSAHLEGAVSEVTVPYVHGCLELPLTVQAVLRILRETP